MLAIYRRSNFDGWDDPKLTLQDALDQLADKYLLRFEFNERAFNFEMFPDILKKEIATPNPIRPMQDTRLDHVLRHVLQRIAVNSGATFVLRDNSIEITTGLFRDNEIWGNFPGPHLPLVHRKFEKVPLEEALKELADMAEFNVVLDARVTEKGKTPVSARFLNTPLDTAVRFLADMCDLRSLQQDNLLYVTTKENAAALEARIEKEKKAAESSDIPGPRWRLGSGPGTIHEVPSPGA
jgi:hypothetical protein